MVSLPSLVRIASRILLGGIALTAGTAFAQADLLNLTGAETASNIAEIRIGSDRINVRLEVYVGDLEMFRDLVPDSLLPADAPIVLTEAERLARFSRESLRISGPDGEPLPVEARIIEPRVRVERNSPFAGMVHPQTGRLIPEAPADKRVLFAELDYLFEGKPAHLTISPPVDANGAAAASIGFIAYHNTVPIIDFRHLTSEAALRLDWDDPWYSRFDNPNLKRHHSNPLMSFLYVEPRQIRHEVLVRLRDLAEWADLDVPPDALIGSDQQERLRAAAVAFFDSRNPVRIDGDVAKPASSRAEFLNIAVGGLQVVEADDAPLVPSAALIGYSQSYPIKVLPDTIEIDWELFSERVDKVLSTATDPAGPYRTFVDQRDPTISWQNFLKKYVDPQVTPVPVVAGRMAIPVISVLLLLGGLASVVLIIRPPVLNRLIWVGLAVVGFAGAVLALPIAHVDVRNPFAGPPSNTEAVAVVDALLGNVHVAYLETLPEDLNRELASIVAEAAFGDVKSELDRALAIRVAGGGLARVEAIEELTVQDIEPLDSGHGFRAVVRWRALANAIHWGHPHRRVIGFRALMELAEANDGWKLAGLTVVDANPE
jgi:hypothetical protein